MARGEYDNTNRISVWENDRKETDTHPDLTGTVNVDGVDYWVSLWENQDAEGKQPVLSGSIRAKDEQRGGGNSARGRDQSGGGRSGSRFGGGGRGRNDDAPRGRAPARSGGRDLDDEIPF